MDINEAFVKEESSSTARIMAHFMALFSESAMIAHMMHLASSSYSEHMALGEYYENVPGLIDSIMETYQGKYGRIELGLYLNHISPLSKKEMLPVAYLTDLKHNITSMRAEMPKDSEIQNEIDELAKQIDSTLYKLRFLK